MALKDVKEDLEGDSTKPDDIFSKLTEGKTFGVPNLLLFAILVFVVVLIIKRRQAKSNANNTAGQFNLPYIGGFPIDIITQGPPGKRGPAGPPGKQGPPGRTPPGHKKRRHRKHHNPPTGGKKKLHKHKRITVPPGKDGSGPPNRMPAPTHPGADITSPHTPAMRQLSVAAVRPTSLKVGGTAQRHNAKKSGVVHHRVPDRHIAKGAHR